MDTKSIVLLLGALASSCDSERISMGYDDPKEANLGEPSGEGGGDTDPPACTDADCAPMDDAAQACMVMMMGLPRCERRTSGECEWVCQAPMVACEPDVCGTPPMEFVMCLNGQVDYYRCELVAPGECAWVLPPCAPM
jgi:hypothetical protein